jgi:peptidoglycan-associated lipoprotein
VQHGNLSTKTLRTVSYGKARNRQVVPGAWGDKGAANRRVVLVIEDEGSSIGATEPAKS